MIVYHGTTRGAVSLIEKEGIRPVPLKATNEDAANGAVCLSASFTIAKLYANRKAASQNEPASSPRTPVVITLNIPDETIHQLDRVYFEHGLYEGYVARETIPPDSILKIEDVPAMSILEIKHGLGQAQTGAWRNEVDQES
jgi:hypothetical protein